ncbi:O-antigen ligase family protein [Paenibacillus sp. CAU 1782]
MAVNKHSANGRSNGYSDIPLIWWLGAFAIALFFVVFPYNRAMFNGYQISFEKTINNGLFYIFALLLISVFYLLRKWKLDSHVGILSILVPLFPVIYWISSLQAVSDYYAVYMTLVYAAFCGLLLVGLYAAQWQSTRSLIEAGMMLSGGIIVLFGLLNLFGQYYYQDALWLAHDGYRLTSVFQYSNTYAGYLIALFLAAVYYAVHGTKTSIRLASAAWLVPIWLSFMLTYSRGAIVVIPVIVLLVLPFLRLSKQIAYVLYMVVSVGVTMLVLGKISSNTAAIAVLVQPTSEKAPSPVSLFSALPLQSWGLLLLASAITTAAIWLYHAKLEKWVERKLEKLSSRKLSTIFMPALIVVAGVAGAALLIGSPAVRSLLPEQLADRVANINFQQHSVLERITFYKDGLSAASDYPMLGAGGGAWQAMYEQYQNNPYESRQAHSFYIQVLVEVGWIGLIALLALLGYIYFLYIRSHIRHPELRGSHFVFFIMSVSLLLHSAIDFDMSYVYIGALVFVSLGCMLAPYASKLAITRFNALTQKPWQQMIYPGAIAVMTVVLLFVTIQNNRALANYDKTLQKAAQQQANFSELITSLDKSISLAPSQSAYSVMKANWLLQGYDQNTDSGLLVLAADAIDQALTSDPYSRGLFVHKIQLLQKSKATEQLLSVVDETLIKFPWDITFYETAMISYDQAHTEALTDQNTDKANAYKTRILEISAEIQRRLDLLATLPPEQQQGRNFAITEPMSAILGSLE